METIKMTHPTQEALQLVLEIKGKQRADEVADKLDAKRIDQLAERRVATAMGALRCGACAGPYPNPDCGHRKNARYLGERVPCVPMLANEFEEVES
jgi:hypothetical protein